MKEVLNTIFAILFLGGLTFVAIASCLLSAELRKIRREDFNDEDENNE